MKRRVKYEWSGFFVLFIITVHSLRRMTHTQEKGERAREDMNEVIFDEANFRGPKIYRLKFWVLSN